MVRKRGFLGLLIHAMSQTLIFKAQAMLYIPCNSLNTDINFWQPQWIGAAVKYKIMGYFFHLLSFVSEIERLNFRLQDVQKFQQSSI